MEILSFDDEASWAREAASRLARALAAAVERTHCATLAVSGGTSPGPILEALAAAQLPWGNITITPTDDRCVGDDHDARNYAALKRWMAVAEREGAALIQLERAGERAGPDAVLLGFGLDHHVASIFPEGEGMDASRAAHAPLVVETTPAPLPEEAPFSRVTLSMPALLGADTIVICAKGAEKRAVYEAAIAADADASPLAFVLAQPKPPITVVWRP